jgi:hypothetical protein
MASRQEHPNAALLDSATRGFGYLFANDIVAAKEHFGGNEDPFHLMGLGVCAFLEAVLGMEVSLAIWDDVLRNLTALVCNYLSDESGHGGFKVVGSL